MKGRLTSAAKRTRRAQKLWKAAGALWSSEVLGFILAQLKAIRVDAAKATFRLGQGQKAATTMLANARATGAKNVDPACPHHKQVVLAWATGAWEGVPDLDTTQATLQTTITRLSRLATDAAASFVLTLLRLGWSAQSARHLATHDGTKVDLLGIAPQTVGYWVDQATLVWTNRYAHWGNSKGPLFWQTIRPLLASGKLEGWSLSHRNVLVKLVSHGIWTQDRISRLRGRDIFCQLCHEGPHTIYE